MAEFAQRLSQAPIAFVRGTAKKSGPFGGRAPSKIDGTKVTTGTRIDGWRLVLSILGVLMIFFYGFSYALSIAGVDKIPPPVSVDKIPPPVSVSNLRVEEKAEIEFKGVRVHVSHEPVSYARGKPDLLLLAGGANLYPNLGFYDPGLVTNWNNIFLEERERFTPINNRKFADVMFRSSLCEKDRENAIAHVRKAVEDAGFTFKALGLCGGTGYPESEGWKGRGKWTSCGEECTGSKIIISFERATENHLYLGEKLFLPFAFGAIPAYRGNGHKWMDLLSVNRRSFIDRNCYSSDQDFANGIVELLRDPLQLERMQKQSIFLQLRMAQDRILFFTNPFEIGEKGHPELVKFLRTSPRFESLKNREIVRYWTPRVKVVPHFLRFALNITQLEWLPAERSSECDLEYDHCCP